MKEYGVENVLIICPVKIGVSKDLYYKICFADGALEIRDINGNLISRIGSTSDCPSPLTNGNATTPELVFLNGDVIMVGC